MEPPLEPANLCFDGPERPLCQALLSVGPAPADLYFAVDVGFLTSGGRAASAQRCGGSARGASRPLEPLGWPNQDFLLAYMAMAPLRCLVFLLHSTTVLPVGDSRPLGPRSAALATKVCAGLHKAPDHLAGS